MNGSIIIRFLLPALFMASTVIFAQPAEHKLSRDEYVERYKDDAVKEMLAHGVPASITLAQGMIESGNGNSALAVYANNHFGIKCHEDWTGMTYTADDNEKDECFRKYNTVLESFSDHSLFLISRDRYSFLFDLKTTDYKGWAKGLSDAGYATDPDYANKLIQVIEHNKLNKLDRMVIMPVKQTPVVVKQPPIKKPSNTIVLLNNNVKYIVAKPGDTYKTLASDLDMGVWQFKKYNETKNLKNFSLKSGDVVYLQPKKRRSKIVQHKVKDGETIYSISQLYAVKMKFIYRKNHLPPGMEPKPGDLILLRNNKKN